MATYVIGDIHGCYEALQRLLREIGFSSQSDRLWLVGDLVNRGPDSLSVLRWARDLGDRARIVLGNHDLRLLAAAHGARAPRPFDDFSDVLDDDNADTLLEWFGQQPFLVQEGSNLLVHAGLLPQWTLEEAGELSKTASAMLTGSDAGRFLEMILGAPVLDPKPSDPLTRAVWAAQVMSRIRLCTAAGVRCTDFSGAPGEAPPGCAPWFDCPSSLPRGFRVHFGHWAMLGVHVSPHAVGLDGGCVYGGHLVAMCLEDSRLVQIAS